MTGDTERPSGPNLLAHVRDAVDELSVEELEDLADYAQALADWKREQPPASPDTAPEDAVDDDVVEDLEEQGVSMDPDDYDDVPATGAYITVKEPKQGYRYYYWQWRDGDTWKNEYIAPVNPKGG
jgi:16S rRNA C967 or C1407 C5-methylase (RsmB/RsmF family)